MRRTATKQTDRSAFTLLEVLVATALLGLLAGSAIWALVQANNRASITRLSTGAQTVAQSRIDYLLNDSPFNPQNNEWGTTSEWKLRQSIMSPPPTIYSEPDPNGGSAQVITGNLTTDIVKITDATIAAGTDLNLYSATVTVTYTFRGRTYTVQLNAVRASDV